MEEENKKSGKGKAILITGLVAGIAGAIGGVLLAPKSGKETRDDLKVLAKDLATRIEKDAKEAKKLTKAKYEELVDIVTDEYSDKKKLTKDVTKELKKDLKARWKEVQKVIKDKK